jgi:hypothetical protein
MGDPMTFGFHAQFVHTDELTRRLAFSDRNDDEAEHYFVIDRSEESPDEAVPDMENVYIERDDQQWGGYGGIDRVVLGRNSLTVQLGRRAVKYMYHDEIHISFDLGDADFGQLREVLLLIMRGYETQLTLRD